MTDPESRSGPELSAGTPLSQRLEEKYGPGHEPTLSLETDQDPPLPSKLLDKLRSDAPRGTRYKLLGEVARGGMGAILKIFDDELRRTLAMKVVLARDAPTGGDTPPVQAKVLERFLEEAQVTGQLDHPGVVPVHELGLGVDGRVYFTMRLVKGEDLSKIFAHVRSGREGWTELRALGVILKVCEAMSYAHSKKVIHRDLKPANVMVGKFGEVYVMDWGLARVLGREDKHDLRIQPQSSSSLSAVKTDRDEVRDDEPESPLITMDGDIVGTPSFMSPEQAKGQLENLGPHSDVYAVGAMLYSLVGGEMPYVPRDSRVSVRTILVSVLIGPPRPLFELAPRAPAELIAIVEKAMARDSNERYPDMRALAEDLRAYLEHRVVRAYKTGAWAESKKWVQRNKSLAAALAGAIVLLVAGLTTSLVYKWRSDDKARIAKLNEERATEQERIATQKSNDVLSLSAIQELKELGERADLLWPATPTRLAEYERWLADARILIEGRAADPTRGIAGHPSLGDHESKLLEIRQRAELFAPGHFEFPSPQERWWHAQLSGLVADLKAFADEKTGLYSEGTSELHGWGIAKRAAFARSIETKSVSGAQARARWSDAIGAIAHSPKYGGLALKPQLGLLPIGADPDSQLWEFAHLATGAPAERGTDGKLKLNESTGLVFVLIPGGSFWMGAQKTDPSGRNFDPHADANDLPVKELTLGAFYMSKYEMTQGQWLRFVGRNPSNYLAGEKHGEQSCSLLNPVEQVSWNDCTEALKRLGLLLPTEAQWEYAARAGTESAWWTGDEPETLAGAANVADAYCKAHGGPNGWIYDEWLDDGCVVHARVGSFRANAFGLHDVIGNVWEWCRDGYGGYDLPTRSDDGERMVIGQSSRVSRGGSFSFPAALARSAMRFSYSPKTQDFFLGLRPVMYLVR